MSEGRYRVGYIDEDPREVAKCTRKLRGHGVDVTGYSISGEMTMDELMQQVQNSQVEMLLIDFKLENLNFNGDGIEKAVDEHYPLFPRIVFTNNKNDAENHLGDWERIIDKEVFNDAERTSRFAEVLTHKIDNARLRIQSRKKVLAELLDKGEEERLNGDELVELSNIEDYLMSSSLDAPTLARNKILSKEKIDDLNEVRKQAEELVNSLIEKRKNESG